MRGELQTKLQGNLVVAEIADRTEEKVRTENQLPGMDSQGLPSLDIPDQGSAQENLRVLTGRLRVRIALRKARALARTPESWGIARGARYLGTL
jgi:hypothetical protein